MSFVIVDMSLPPAEYRAKLMADHRPHDVRGLSVLTEIGSVEIDVPRDTNSSFEPQIVKTRQRRLTGIDEMN